MYPLTRQIAVFAMLFLSLLSHAAQREQPISISADHVTIDEKTGNSLYRGNVILVQGDIQILAALLTISSQDGKLYLITTEGKPTSFSRSGEAPIKAQSGKMVYKANDGVITLTGEARLQRAGDEFSSELIRYYVEENRVEASGDQKKNTRVHVILQPQTEAQ
jgi:lipopolysaccharide export system protein LptA